MKSHAITALLVLSFLAVHAAHAQVAFPSEWRGGGKVTFQTNGCLDDGIGGGVRNIFFVGQTVSVDVNYRPMNVGINSNQTQIGFHNRFSTHAFRVPADTSLNGTFVDVEGRRLATYGGNYTNQPSIRVLQQSPSTIGTSTKFIRLRGQIRNYQDEQGCRALFDVALTQREDPLAPAP